VKTIQGEALLDAMARQYMSQLRRAVINDDYGFLESLGLSSNELEELKKFSELRQDQIDRFFNDGNSFFNITLNRKRYLNALLAAKRQSDYDKLIIDLIKADAPNQLFKDHFAMRSEDIAHLRRDSKIIISNPSKLTSIELDQVFDAYQTIMPIMHNDQYVIPRVGLYIYEKTRIGIRRFYTEVLSVT